MSGLDQAVVERIAGLKVRVQRAVEGVRSGVHRSPHRGASVVFAEHRDYRPGDDTRLLDWRAFARNDRYTIKHFEQETHLKAQLVLDLSPSMAYGEPDKAACGATLLGALAMVLLRQGDAVGASTFAADLQASLPTRGRGDHLDELLTFLGAQANDTGGTDLEKSLLSIGERIGRRGLVVLASDLLDSSESALRPLSMLRARGHEVWVFHVLHRDELELPFNQPARFADPESDATVELDPLALRASYQRELDAFIDDRRSRCVAAGCRYQLAPSDAPVQQVLADALQGRSR